MLKLLIIESISIKKNILLYAKKDIFWVSFFIKNQIFIHMKNKIKLLFVGFFLLLFSTKAFSQYNMVYITSEEFPFKISVNGDLYSEDYEYDCILKDFDAGLYRLSFEFQYELYNFNYVLKIKSNTYKHFKIEKALLTKAERKMKSLNETISKDLNIKDEEEAEANKAMLKYTDYKLLLELVEEKPMTFVDMDAFEQLRVEVNQNKSLLPGYHGLIACTTPMGEDQFQQAKQSIENKNTEESRLLVAKQIIGLNCFFVHQLKTMAMLFETDEAKLEIARLAFNKTYDIGNYYQLSDVFEKEESIAELNAIIQANTQ